MKEDWKAIVENFGLDEQIKHWFSEQYELVQAIERDDGTIECRKHIISELADNFNFLKQIQVYYRITDEEVEEEQRFKNERTLKDIEEDKEIEKIKINLKSTEPFTEQIEDKLNELIKTVNELKNK